MFFLPSFCSKGGELLKIPFPFVFLALKQDMASEGNNIISKALHKRRTLQTARWNMIWGILSLIIALILWIDIYDGAVSRYLRGYSPLLCYLEAAVAVMFSMNFLTDLYKYLSYSVFDAPLEISLAQKKILGISDQEDGFETPTKNSSVQKNDSMSENLLLSHSILSSSTPNNSDTKWSNSRSSTYLESPYSWNGNFSASPSWNSTSTPYSSGLMDSSVLSTSSSSWIYADKSNVVRSRTTSTQSKKLPPINAEDVIADERKLKQYLNEFENQDNRSLIGNPENWAFNGCGVDYAPLLQKYQYQLACKSPQSPTSRDDADLLSQQTGDEVWTRLGVSWQETFCWIESLRRWISQTILSRVLKEIESINETLQRVGSPDLQISSVSVSMLQQRQTDPNLKSLQAVIPYLDVTPNQEYLLQRLRELCKGGCMSEFRWNCGGNFKGKPWDEHLPTDSAIVMHFLCCYFDARLPPDTSNPNGKTFTNKHFLKTPDKPDLSKKDLICIYQSKLNPPHYQLVIGGAVNQLAPGRNNMFLTILLFIHHIKTKENGMLGRINLGLSGINILWIVNQDKEKN